MITREEVKVDHNDYELSLVKISGQQIKDIYGYITQERGDCTFKITSIVFEDGTEADVEGEHDLPYIAAYDETAKHLNLDDENLSSLYR